MQSKENKPKTIKTKVQKDDNKIECATDNDKKKNDNQLKKESKTKTIKSETELIKVYQVAVNYDKSITDFNKESNCKMSKIGIQEIISENAIKFFIKNHLKKECHNALIGDLVVKENNNYSKIECKCFTSNGPISFGPTEKWDKLIFLDSRKWLDNQFIIIEVNLSNTDKNWKEIIFNKNENETYESKCKKGVRPRMNWYALEKILDQPNLKENKKILYSGTFENMIKLTQPNSLEI